MVNTVYALFDGQSFIPERNVDFQPNERYLIKVEVLNEKKIKKKKNILKRISERATNLGIPDFAEQHDHYLYGTEKR